MQDKKERLTLTLDHDVIESIKDRAKQQTAVAGMKVSISAAANMMLRERAAQDKPTTAAAQDRPAQPKLPMTRPAPKPGAQSVRREDVDDER